MSFAVFLYSESVVIYNFCKVSYLKQSQLFKKIF